jgi:protein SCO1
MPKALTLRSLPVLAAAFAVSGIITVTVGEFAASPVMLARGSAPAVAREDLPNVAIETAYGMRTTLAATDGHIRIATMVYSHCPGVCPMTIAALRSIDSQLTAQQQAGLSFVLLSLDPARDSPGALRSLARERGIESSRWLLGRTSESDARAFASAVGIQYRPLSDGSIDHSTSLLLIDARGRLLARGDATDATEFIAAVRQALDRR